MARITTILLILFSLSSMAQSQQEPGKEPAFTNESEWIKLKKTYPFIEEVRSTPGGNISIERNVEYCRVGKRKLKLDIFQPVHKTGPRPAIMIIHGGGWRSGNKKQHHALAERLTELGYVCFTPEYRLSGEAIYPAAVNDLKSALRWIHAHAAAYLVDTTRIAVAGFSAGGQLAALLGTTMDSDLFNGNDCNKDFSANFQAIIDMDGILAFIHPESGEGDDRKKTSAATHWFGSSKTENPALWKEASALTYVNDRTPPVLFLNSSVARMHAGRDDFIHILDRHEIYSEVKTFTGAPHSFPLFQPWFDSVVLLSDAFLRKVFDQKENTTSTIIVAADGSGHYTRVQDALNAIPLNNSKPVTVYIRNGVYKEKLVLDSSKRFVTLLGEDKYHTILSYDDHTGRITSNGDTINTYTSQSFLIRADDFTARNLTIENTAGFTAGQAVAIQVQGDRSAFFNCRFIGNQDVLFPSRANTRQYFENCYIEGTTDFIFGPSTAWFENCHIHSKKNSHITAASTPLEIEFGYVFNDCVLTGDTVLKNVSLGRPWRDHASVVYLNCYMGQHIKAEGWSNWNNTERYRTARYAEYQSYGPSSDPSKRVPWSRQLTGEEAKKITIKNLFGNWDPKKDNQ